MTGASQSMMVLAVLMMIGTTSGGIYRHDIDPSIHERLASDPAFSAVGLVRDSAGKPIGSFVIIDPDWVLTAAHVVEDRTRDDIVLEIAEKRLAVREIVTHPQYKSEHFATHAEALFRKGIDIALLRLETTTAIRPARLNRHSREVGEEATLVGFGTSGDAMSAVRTPIPPGTKRAGRNTIDQAGGTVEERPIPHWYLVSDFDHPTNGRLNRTGSARPLDLEFQMAGGDSGGGLFIEQDGAWKLAGINVTSRVAVNDAIDRDGIYGSLTMSVRIVHVREWIDSVTTRRNGKEVPNRNL